MTLIVTTFKRDSDTERIIDDPYPENGKDIGGPESWRYKVWASKAIIESGATFLPQLKDYDLYIEGDQLHEFKSECIKLLKNVNVIADKLNFDSCESIGYRLKNFLDATEKAIKENGGVYIG